MEVTIVKDITIVALNSSIASTFTGPMDVFSLSGVFWNSINGKTPAPHFSVHLVTGDGKPAKCINGISAIPQGSVHDIQKTDLVVLSAIGGDKMSDAIDANRNIIPWILDMHKKGAWIASVCTGAFVLAETGLLKGRTATTHWGFIKLFKRRYPNIHCRADALITDDTDLYCSGGITSCFDLSLYLVEKLSGRPVALQCAKTIVHELGRSVQAPYAALIGRRTHRDSLIHNAQNRFEENYANNLSISLLAKESGMSERNFQRRFREATGDTPLSFLQKVRTEVARDLLESTDKSFEEITFHVGYDDAGSFRKIFRRQTGLLPRDYQKLYRKE
jgi:transcriptional regulator GlxA family with amidase domain